MYKKVRCTCKVVVLPTKSIVVLDVLVAVASSDRKVPILAGKRDSRRHSTILGTLRSNDATATRTSPKM